MILRAFLLFVVLFQTSHGDWYSSVGHMEELMHKELDLVSYFKQYISNEEEKMAHAKAVMEDLIVEAKEAITDTEGHLSHPVNQYLLMKRLNLEFQMFDQLVEKNDDALNEVMKLRHEFPSETDVDGCATALLRLQKTYKLDTHKLADGIVYDSDSGKSLSADDCWKIGKIACNDKNYELCESWMRIAYQKMYEDGTTGESWFDVLEHLASALSNQGKWFEAYTLTIKMLQHNPDHERAQENYDYYRNMSTKKGDEGDVEQISYSKWYTPNDQKDLEFEKSNSYENLCRQGGESPSPEAEKELKCYYWDNNDPLLRIQPLKLEELWKMPHLIRFYDIISDNEISDIKTMAKPRLSRATVQNPETGILESADYRVSKSAWLSDAESDVVFRISRRISAATGLAMQTAEELQIANYGVGSQYEPHYDFAHSGDKGHSDEKEGNRIATMLFYLTNVEYGGETIFLNPKIAVKPIKRSAVFWYNLYPSGEGDRRTLHAACPVLNGVKWVANKWIHERDQEFRRPCVLDQFAGMSIF